jgi:peroxiredoxin
LKSSLVALALVALAGAASAADVSVESLRAPAAPFTLETLDGGEMKLADALRRGPVVLDFWATWCKPCLAAIPELEELHRAYAPRGVTVIGISVDNPRSFARVRPAVKRLGITYPVGIDDDGALQEKYGLQAMPTTMVVDTNGVVVHVLQGYHAGAIAALGGRLDALLGAAPDTADTD